MTQNFLKIKANWKRVMRISNITGGTVKIKVGMQKVGYKRSTQKRKWESFLGNFFSFLSLSFCFDLT